MKENPGSSPGRRISRGLRNHVAATALAPPSLPVNAPIPRGRWFTCDHAPPHHIPRRRDHPLRRSPIVHLPVLTPEQRHVLAQIEDFLADDEQQVFVVGGLAGTGKTLLLGSVARMVDDPLLVAPTGKAAAVLRAKTGLPAQTIHSLIYRLTGVSTDQRGREEPIFEPRLPPGALTGQVVLVDECSMISERMGQDLADTGATIAAFGDFGQLPPVQGVPYFTEPDAVLRQIHRQARESAIIRQAHAVRAGGRYKSEGPDFVVKSWASPADIAAADVILCNWNPTRHRLNRFARAIRGFRQPGPQAGELVVCGQNCPQYGVFNGETYTLTRPYDWRAQKIWLERDGDEFAIPRCDFLMDEDDTPHRRCATWFDYGYCLTTWKAQGSSWPAVLVLDEISSFFPMQRRRWLYTAITRAEQRVVIAQGVEP